MKSNKLLDKSLKFKFSIFSKNLKILFMPNMKGNKLIDKYLSYVECQIKCNGKVTATKTLKEIHRLTSRYIMRQSNNIQIGPIWIRTNKEGLPSILGLSQSEQKALRQDVHYQRFLLNLLNSYRLIVNEIDYDISTIIEPLHVDLSLCGNRVEEITSSMEKTLALYRIEEFEKETMKSPIHVSTKAGASGPRTMGHTSLCDLKALIRDEQLQYVENLATLVYSGQSLSSFSKVLEQSKIIAENSTSLISNNINQYLTMRLHFIAEGGGKTRVICIGDIWSQCVLKPIHKYLMDCLKKFPNDGTKSHDKIAMKVKEFTKMGLDCYCYDLTAVTDRMPFELQFNLIEFLTKEVSPDLSLFWKELMLKKFITKTLLAT